MVEAKSGTIKEGFIWVQLRDEEGATSSGGGTEFVILSLVPEDVNQHSLMWACSLLARGSRGEPDISWGHILVC